MKLHYNVRIAVRAQGHGGGDRDRAGRPARAGHPDDDARSSRMPISPTTIRSARSRAWSPRTARRSTTRAVICEYLDSLHDGPKMFPPAGPARWRALRRQAEGDGIMDAAVLARYETFLRPEERRWPEWIEGQKAEVPPRPRQPRGRGRRFRRYRRHRHDHASAARSATSISATATRTGGRRGRGSPPGSSASRSGRAMARTAPVEIW